MSLLGNLFSKEQPYQDIRSPQSQVLGKTYLSALQQGLSGYVPGADYGSVSVPLTDIEKQSLDLTKQYLGQNILQTEPYAAGRAYTLSQLSGGFDPTTSPTYQAYRTETAREQQKAIDEARRGQAIRGAFRSSGGLRQEGDIITDITNRRNTLLAQLQEAERQRQTQAATTALGLGEYEFGLPATQAATAQQLGSLERLNQVANLEREYQKYLNQRQEQMTALGYAGQASNQGQPVYGTTSYSQPTLLGSLAGSFAGGLGMGLGSGSLLGGSSSSGGGGLNILNSGGLSSIMSGMGLLKK
ncbi:MAG: hypothetical protein ABIJ17_01875 [Patescibacteria group bacterium]